MTEDPSMDANTYLTELEQNVLDRFHESLYQDPETAQELTFHIYVPEDTSRERPLVVYIPDLSCTGRDHTRSLHNTGALVWADREFQQKYSPFVVIPHFEEKIIEDDGPLPIVDLIPKFIDALIDEFMIDRHRIYVTGQSMGCMTFLSLCARYPGKYAAALFVSGQQPVSALSALKDQKFIYVTAAGDAKASQGADDLMRYFLQEKIPFAEASGWDAQASVTLLNTQAETLLSQGYDHHFIRFAEGTVLTEKATSPAAEHMASFNYAYMIPALREWLFLQKTE